MPKIIAKDRVDPKDLRAFPFVRQRGLSTFGIGASDIDRARRSRSSLRMDLGGPVRPGGSMIPIPPPPPGPGLPPPMPTGGGGGGVDQVPIPGLPVPPGIPGSPFNPRGGGGGLPGLPGGGGGGLGGVCGFLPSWAQGFCDFALQPGCNFIKEMLGLCDPPGAQPGEAGGLAPSSCGPGRVRIGDQCVAPGDAFPGGSPMTVPAGGNAVQGAFGMPAMTPVTEQRVHRTCPEGMVLGKDNLCYPKQVLPRRSKFRKWRPSPRPKVSHADFKAIRKAKSVKKKLKSLGKDAGLKVKNR